MKTINKIKTVDGYKVYRVKKSGRWYNLANPMNYQKEIEEMIEGLEGLIYDSLIIIFGVDTGMYLIKLEEKLCPNNRVIIFEPDKKIYKEYKDYKHDQIKIILYRENQIKSILGRNINFLNYNRLFFHVFGNYAEVYEREYQELIDCMDDSYINAASCLGLADRFKEVFAQNMMSNLEIVNQANSLNQYIDYYRGIPAIVVSAGPSLEQNIQDMLKYKEKLKRCFIITGSRTVGTLVKAGIMPDMIVSVDPIEANYDMMKEYLDLKVPLAFYEYSNQRLLKEYQGEKIYIATLFSRVIEELHSLRGVYLGGSVAHSCIDISYMMGCAPIILMGQDLAYTKGKHHAESATFKHDQKCDHNANMSVDDVFGNRVATTLTLDLFRKNLEAYIEMRNKQKGIYVINCSEGAAIKGADYKPVDKVFSALKIQNLKNVAEINQDVSIDNEEVTRNIMSYIDKYSELAEAGLSVCNQIIEENHEKSLMDVEEDDLDLQMILYVLDIVEEFENSNESGCLGGYYNRFMYDIKEEKFKMLAKDYNELTSDLQYQAQCFREYFKQMQCMLNEVNGALAEWRTVTE